MIKPNCNFRFRLVKYLNMVTAKRDTGPVLASCSKWRGQFRLLISSIPRAMAGDVCGCSICHTCVPEDSLDVNYMNVHPGGEQRVMCDGLWDCKPQSMNRNGGMKHVLEERGVLTHVE